MNTKLKEIRLAKGLSRADLAGIVGISVRFISFLEMGLRKPSLPVAFKISRALGVSVDDIFLPNYSTKSTKNDKNVY